MVRSGSPSVKIYSAHRGPYESHTVAHYQAGARRRKVFADIKEAREEARHIADLLAAGKADDLPKAKEIPGEEAQGIGPLPRLGPRPGRPGLIRCPAR